jgi:hypothetical protein
MIKAGLITSARNKFLICFARQICCNRAAALLALFATCFQFGGKAILTVIKDSLHRLSGLIVGGIGDGGSTNRVGVHHRVLFAEGKYKSFLLFFAIVATFGFHVLNF